MGGCKLLGVVLVVALAAFTSGCATVTKGSSQAVTLHTDPEGATCDISRESKVVASLAATPGQVTVGREMAAIDISCRKKSYQPSNIRVDSSVEGWTFGNILIGGIIGFAVDAASGAMRQYPQFITLTLVPEEFSDTAARDLYVKERLDRFNNEGAKATEELNKRCGPEACASDHKMLEAAKAKRIALFNEKVSKARIRAAGPPGN